jgi:predicted dehydrogenase
LKVDLFGSVKHITAEHHLPNFVVTATQMLALGTSKYFWPHLAELQHFVNSIIQDATPSPSGLDGLKDLEAITKAYANEVELEKS